MKKIYKKILPYLAALLVVYLISNIVWSQNISNIYFELNDIKSNKKDMQKGAFDFLISIKKLPVYKAYFDMYKRIFWNSLESDISYENKKRVDYLKSLNQLIKENPKSRDVLYKLYIFYKNDGNLQKAHEYLNKIKEVDPSFTLEK